MNRTRATCLAAVALTLSLAGCGRASQGQEAGRPDPKLDRKVEELLPRIQEFAHLEAKRAPLARRASSETLRSYLLERLEAEYPGERLAKIELAYKNFGLLPDTLELRSLMVNLLLEQAIGYYDPVQDVLFIRDEAPEALLDAVIVHELVHALQDQLIDLDSLLTATKGNDARTALQTAVEGHAMAAMLAYQFAQVTGSSASAEELPEIGPEMGALVADAGTYPQLAQAPAVIREPLLFAYLGGARFIQRLWRSQPERPVPFGEWMPESTEQLLHTERLLQERDRPVSLQIGEGPDGWEVEYSGDLGELEIRIYFEVHQLGRNYASAAAAGWDGDAYALLSRGEQLALVWYTAWDGEKDAEEFAQAYRDAFSVRFAAEVAGNRLTAKARQATLEQFVLAGVPLVRVVETPTGVELESIPAVAVRE